MTDEPTLDERCARIEEALTVGLRMWDDGLEPHDFDRDLIEPTRAALADIRIIRESVGKLEKQLDGLSDACEREGLWPDKGGVSVRVLVRHLDGNREAVYGVQKTHIGILREQVERVRALPEKWRADADATTQQEREEDDYAFWLSIFLNSTAAELEAALSPITQEATCPTCGGYGYVESSHVTAEAPCPDKYHQEAPK